MADALREVPGAILGVLPGGRGNDLARVLGIPRDPLAACAAIAHGLPVRWTSARSTARAFVGIASAGFDSDANRIANQAPARLGNLVYAYGALRALASWRPVDFEIELEPAGRARQLQRLHGRRGQLPLLWRWDADRARRVALRTACSTSC